MNHTHTPSTHEASHEAPHKTPHAGCDHGHAHQHPAPAAAAPLFANPTGVPRFRIATMDCSAEESDIRRALEPLAGIRSLSFKLSERTLAIDAPAQLMPEVLQAIQNAGFNPEPLDAHASNTSAAKGWLDRNLMRLLGALLLALGAELTSFFAPDTPAWQWLSMGLAAAAIYCAGFETYQKGLVALSKRKLNINALMTVAVTGAFIIGQWPEAAMVMALYAIAELIEAKAVDRARNAIQGLLALAPDAANVQQADGTWLLTLVEAIPLNALVQIKPGERVAMDGVVVKGHSTINQASVTGESMPVEKTVGDLVFAGTINETGLLEYTVTARAGQSTLARIVQAVEQAQGTRAPTQRFVDRFAAIYTPAVFVLAIAVALGLPLALGTPWLAAAYKALVLLVIACPCALVISTPVTVVSGLAVAAKQGILIKGGVYLENARKIKAIALDKTGTITEGKPQLVAQHILSTAMPSAAIFQVAYSLCANSDHPVSKAVSQGLMAALAQPAQALTVDEFTALAGRGVEGKINHAAYALGNYRLVEERNLSSAALASAMGELETKGYTLCCLMSATEALAIFAVADTIKASSQQAIARLIELGVTPVMLTGDNAATAKNVAAQAGILDARGNLLPADKLAAIQQMQAQYGLTAMSGDGINDAPALAQADIGFAMGAAGTDIAMEAADVVIMNDDLQRIASTIVLSRKTHAILWQNIGLALGIKSLFLLQAVLGDASMWMAVFADMGASLLVILNGWRLMKAKI